MAIAPLKERIQAVKQVLSLPENLSRLISFRSAILKINARLKIVSTLRRSLRVTKTIDASKQENRSQDKFADELLSDDELDNVAGVGEYFVWFCLGVWQEAMP